MSYVISVKLVHTRTQYERNSTVQEQELVEKNLGLVRFVINKYYYSHRTDEDVFQEGCLGLVKAAEEFVDKRTDYAFSTYACSCIKNQIRKYLANESRRIDEVTVDKTFGYDPIENVEFPIEGFSDEENRIIELFVAGLNVDEAANILNKSVNYVKRKKRSILRKCRERDGGK